MEDELQRLLRELSAAIARTREGDENREELTRLLSEVERRLKADVSPEEHHGLINALKEAEVRFESDHPLLGRALQHAVQALSAAGI